jgi:hypothetical protein
MFRCEFQNLKGNERLTADWHDLLSRVRPELRLFGPRWYSAWDETIGSQAPWTGGLTIATAYDESSERLCGVMPLGHPRYKGIGVRCLGGYFQPWRLILAEQDREFAVGHALGEFLVRSRFGVVQLGPWPASLFAHQGLLESLAARGVPLARRTTMDLALVTMPPTWDDYVQQIYGRKAFKKLQKRASQLASEHKVEIEHLRKPSAAEIRNFLAECALVEQHSWLMTTPKGRPRFVQVFDRAFWQTVLEDWLVPNGFFDGWIMRANHQPICFLLALTCGSTRYSIAGSYDEAFRDYSVGSQLDAQMFEEGYSRGVTHYDLGTKELHYKQRWGASAADQVESMTAVIHPVLRTLWHTGAWVQGLCKRVRSRPTVPASPPDRPSESGHQNASQDPSPLTDDLVSSTR